MTDRPAGRLRSTPQTHRKSQQLLYQRGSGHAGLGPKPVFTQQHVCVQSCASNWHKSMASGANLSSSTQTVTEAKFSPSEQFALARKKHLAWIEQTPPVRRGQRAVCPGCADPPSCRGSPLLLEPSQPLLVHVLSELPLEGDESPCRSAPFQTRFQDLTV